MQNKEEELKIEKTLIEFDIYQSVRSALSDYGMDKLYDAIHHLTKEAVREERKRIEKEINKMTHFTISDHRPNRTVTNTVEVSEVLSLLQDNNNEKE